MKASELIEALQKLIDKHGDQEVTYVDNGDFAEEWPEINPVFCPAVKSNRDFGKIVSCIVL